MSPGEHPGKVYALKSKAESNILHAQLLGEKLAEWIKIRAKELQGCPNQLGRLGIAYLPTQQIYTALCIYWQWSLV